MLAKSVPEIPDLGHVDLEVAGDPLPPFLGQAVAPAAVALGDALDAGAQAAQVEEQRLLGGGGAGADDGPVAQDVVLHGRADPPGRVGGKAHLAVRLEAAGRLHQSDVALLNEIAHGQAVVAEPRGGRHHQPGVGADQLVKGPFVAALAPFAGEIEFVVARQQRLTHGSLDETQIRALSLGIVDVGHTSLPSRLGGRVSGCSCPVLRSPKGQAPSGPMIRRFTMAGSPRIADGWDNSRSPRPVARHTQHKTFRIIRTGRDSVAEAEGMGKTVRKKGDGSDLEQVQDFTRRRQASTNEVPTQPAIAVQGRHAVGHRDSLAGRVVAPHDAGETAVRL